VENSLIVSLTKKRMKKALLLFLVLSLFMATKAQLGINFEDSPFQRRDSISKNPSFSLSSGAFVMGNRQQHIFGSHITPILTFDKAKKFSYGFGTQISNIQTSGFSNMNSEDNFPKSYFQNSMFVFGRYQATEKLQISGFLYQDMPLNRSNNFETKTMMQENKGFYLDFNYQINKNTYFQIGIDYNQGNSPMNRHTGFSNRYSSPFFTP
jgi:hypothetical protein